jgi:tetratricopeptide (TPR) repeat protein
MKIWERTALWATAVAKIWAAHWLLILGAFSVFVSLILKWVDFPFSRHPLGLQLPLLRNVELIPHLSLFSYGVVGGAILTAGLVLRRRSGRFLAVVAAILIAFCVMLPCQIAFQQPALLGRLTAETQDLSMIRGFTKSYLPANYGPAEEYSQQLELDTIWGRFVAAYSFLGLGWYCFGIGSLLIAIYSIGRLPGERGMTALALGGIPIGVLIILLTPPFIGQHYFTSACTAQAQGNNEKAITYYRRAMWLDRWRAQNIDIYATIGDLERLSGSGEDSPEKHISKAEEFKEAREYELAVFELSRAAAWGGAVAKAARHESARIRVYFGTALYHEGGIGAAVTQWQQAIVENPLPQEGLAFLIARGNYDLGRYQAALDAVNRVLRAASDEPVLANAYSLAGDSYMKLGREVEARNSYNHSLAEDMYVNFWGMSRLIGN